MEEHAAGRLSVIQQVHGQQAPTGGAVHLSCPPLQAGVQGHAKACAPGGPSPRPAPSVPAPLFPCTIRTIRELITCKNHPSPGGTRTHTHTHTHTQVRQMSAGVTKSFGRCRQVSQKIAAGVSAKYARARRGVCTPHAPERGGGKGAVTTVAGQASGPHTLSRMCSIANARTMLQSP